MRGRIVSADRESWLFFIPFVFALLSLVQSWPLKLKDAEWTPFIVLVGTFFILMINRVILDLGVLDEAVIWLIGAGVFYGWLRCSKRSSHLLMNNLVLLGWLVVFGVFVEGAVGFRWMGVAFTALTLVSHVVGSQLRDKNLWWFAVLASIIGLVGTSSTYGREHLKLQFLLGVLLSLAWWIWAWRNREEYKAWRREMEGMRTIVVGVWLGLLLTSLLDGFLLAGLFGVVSVSLMVVWKFLRAYSLSWLGLAFSFSGMQKLLDGAEQGLFPWMLVFYFLLFVGQGIWLAHSRSDSFLAQPKVASVMWGGAAMGLVLYGLVTRTEVASWTTASWAIAAVALLAGGFWFGLRGYRFIALGGILATMVRLFMVDVQDSFWRIVAFGVTGVLLVGIGYLYNRFHRRLADGDLDWGLAEEA